MLSQVSGAFGTPLIGGLLQNYVFSPRLVRQRPSPPRPSPPPRRNRPAGRRPAAEAPQIARRVR